MRRTCNSRETKKRKPRNVTPVLSGTHGPASLFVPRNKKTLSILYSLKSFDPLACPFRYAAAVLGNYEGVLINPRL